MTAKFTDMQIAEKEKVLILFKDNGKKDGEMVTLMTFSTQMKQKFVKFEKFKKGKLGYLFSNKCIKMVDPIPAASKVQTKLNMKKDKRKTTIQTDTKAKPVQTDTKTKPLQPKLIKTDSKGKKKLQPVEEVDVGQKRQPADDLMELEK